MSGYAIFWPVLAHVALVYCLFILLRLRREKLRGEGRMSIEDIELNRGDAVESLQVKNCIANQFEAPVLFYLCTVMLYITEADSLPMVILAWVFVISRYAHAFVHVTSNRLSVRFPLFMTGFLGLAVMWVWLAIWMAGS